MVYLRERWDDRAIEGSHYRWDHYPLLFFNKIVTQKVTPFLYISIHEQTKVSYVIILRQWLAAPDLPIGFSTVKKLLV